MKGNTEKTMSARPRQKRVGTHKRAKSIPSTAAKLRQARTRWPNANPVERGDMVRELKALGCTGRGLALDFGCTEGIIRVYEKVAALPEVHRAGVAGGAAASVALKRRDAEIRAAQERKKDELEARKGLVTDWLAGRIMALIKSESGLASAYMDSLFNAVHDAIRARSHVLVMPVLSYQGFANRRKVAELIAASRPSEKEIDFHLALVAEWIVRFLHAIESDENRRYLAVRKAEQLACGRVK